MLIKFFSQRRQGDQKPFLCVLCVLARDIPFLMSRYASFGLKSSQPRNRSLKNLKFSRSPTGCPVIIGCLTLTPDPVSLSLPYDPPL